MLPIHDVVAGNTVSAGAALVSSVAHTVMPTRIRRRNALLQTRCNSDRRRRGLPPAHPVAKWVSNVAMQVTSKNNHKKFGNIWGCFRLKYRTGTGRKWHPETAITTAFHAPPCRKCRPAPPVAAACRQINGARFFADFFSLESFSIRYFI
ncbi:hypothetical protein EMIT0111MI5_10860 [Burkholderia sp. IT-111MI5]